VEAEHTPWTKLLARPGQAANRADVAAWWTSNLAPRLLLGAELRIAGQLHRLAEIEFYYHAPGIHDDPFAHGDACQLTSGQWYLHRTGSGFRGGSYKGIDLTFGDGHAHGGILIRSLECPDGHIVEGPSLCVDHVLKCCGQTQVAALDKAIGARPAWGDNPVALHWLDTPEDAPVVQSGRVGLTLKRVATFPKMAAMIFQPYRYLRKPRALRKGRNYVILALHHQGLTPGQIAEVTGSPARAIARQIDGYHQGWQDGEDPSLAAFHGKALSATVLAQMCGAWARHHA